MKRRRIDTGRSGQWEGPSPLTASIVSLALIVWVAQALPATIYSDCDYAFYWVSGWFAFSSLFQWTGAALAAMAALWLISFLDRDARENWGEALAQGALLFALAFWLFALKSYLFPFAPPTHARMIAIVDAAFPRPVVFDEDFRPRPGADEAGRPKVEFEDHPMFDPAINRKPREIFISRHSPTGADMQRLDACRAEQRRALAQWEKDRETLRAWYDREFYRESPKRPRNWMEERMEEIERTGLKIRSSPSSSRMRRGMILRDAKLRIAPQDEATRC